MRIILWMIVCLKGPKRYHVATKSQLLLAIDCFQPHIFNWCKGVLHQVKAELAACKTRAQREFGYGTLIVSFFLERLPVLRPQMSLGLAGPRETRQRRWDSLIHRTRGGPIRHFFEDDFFEWLNG